MIRIPSRPEILFQSCPLDKDPVGINPLHKKSWTRSHPAYQYTAGLEYPLVRDNPRRPRHEIIINYLEEFFIQDILEKFRWIKERLEEHGVVAYSVVEITRDDYKKHPVNWLHYHFLVDSHLSKGPLVEVFKEACIHAGHKLDETCRVHHRPIPDPKRDKDKNGNLFPYEVAFRRRLAYILKYDIPTRPPILFRPETDFPHLKKGISKTDMVGHYFINEDGTRANKGDLRNARRIRRHPEKPLEELLYGIMKLHPEITMSSRWTGRN